MVLLKFSFIQTFFELLCAGPLLIVGNVKMNKILPTGKVDTLKELCKSLVKSGTATHSITTRASHPLGAGGGVGPPGGLDLQAEALHKRLQTDARGPHLASTHLCLDPQLGNLE